LIVCHSQAQASLQGQFSSTDFGGSRANGPRSAGHRPDTIGRLVIIDAAYRLQYMASSRSIGDGKTDDVPASTTTCLPYTGDMDSSATTGRLIIVCGLPGSGKTTLAKAFERKLNAVRLSADEWMDALGVDVYDEARRAKIEALQWVVGRRLLALGLKVIIEWGTWGRHERDALRLGARELGVAVELHYLSASADELFARIERRGMENPPIAREAVLRWTKTIQVPTPDEFALFDAPLIFPPDTVS
jgi:predicted kinase